MKLPLLFTCLTCALAASPSSAQFLEQDLVKDAADGHLHDFDSLSAALIASGVNDLPELQRYRDSYTVLRRQTLADASLHLQSDPHARLHAALHRHILKGAYQSSATDLRIPLLRGDFNCLSAVAIYLDLCRSLNQEIEILLLPGHVCLRANSANLQIIDPGNPNGLPPPSAASQIKGARQITPLELLGKFYYNRGIRLLENHEYESGLHLLQLAVQLDPADADARDNLAAGFNNWAVEHLRAKRFDQASDLIERGLALSPSFAPLIANQQFLRAKLSH
jgi:tetratricopeptide (TPR) repeat protein